MTVKTLTLYNTKITLHKLYVLARFILYLLPVGYVVTMLSL